MQPNPNSRTPFQLLSNCLLGALGQKLAASELPANANEWETVLRLSGAHLVTPQLRWALLEQGLFSDVPPDVAEYLDAVHTLSLEKNQQCEEQLAHLLGVLNGIGVQPVFLKGSAALIGRLYPSSGERMVSDIDVLVPAARLPDILDRLAGVGYRLVNPKEDISDIEHPDALSHHHYPAIYSPDWPVAVELHVQPVLLSFVNLLSCDEVFQDATAVRWRGGDCLLPSPTHFVMHNIIHSYLVDTRYHLASMSLRQLFEFVLVSQSYGERIDWHAINSRFSAAGCRDELAQYLVLAQICLGFNVATGIDLDGWDRLRVQPYLARLNLENRALRWVVIVVCQIIVRLRNLWKDPGSIRKLLTADLYTNFRNSIRF